MRGSGEAANGRNSNPWKNNRRPLFPDIPSSLMWCTGIFFLLRNCSRPNKLAQPVFFPTVLFPLFPLSSAEVTCNVHSIWNKRPMLGHHEKTNNNRRDRQKKMSGRNPLGSWLKWRHSHLPGHRIGRYTVEERGLWELRTVRWHTGAQVIMAQRHTVCPATHSLMNYQWCSRDLSPTLRFQTFRCTSPMGLFFSL